MKDLFPFWVWFFLLTVVGALLWGSGSWFNSLWQEKVEDSPFLQVTNRDFSLFLWQFPEYMRVNVKNKSGYLPGFQYEKKVGLLKEQADNYVQAPPDLLFLYHTWNRLLKEDFEERPISKKEFQAFLSDAEEWDPRYWSKAPQSYVNFIKNLPNAQEELPLYEIPREVQISFQGWKNYFKEGKMINALQPTQAQVKEFIEKHPNYGRNFWRNIFENYLLGIDKNDPNSLIPENELSPFLRVALFNFTNK